MSNLLISVLGHCNAGKSSTWYELFGREVRTSRTGNSKRLEFDNGEYVDVVVINGSPQERGEDIEDLLKGRLPRIVLCSIQYIARAIEAYDYFVTNGYCMYLQWLNPGYMDDSGYNDNIGIEAYVASKGGVLSKRDAKASIEDRVKELKNYLYQWAKDNDQLKCYERVS